jgi:hypothetical protein
MRLRVERLHQLVDSFCVRGYLATPADFAGVPLFLAEMVR